MMNFDEVFDFMARVSSEKTKLYQTLLLIYPGSRTAVGIKSLLVAARGEYFSTVSIQPITHRCALAGLSSFCLSPALTCTMRSSILDVGMLCRIMRISRSPPCGVHCIYMHV